MGLAHSDHFHPDTPGEVDTGTRVARRPAGALATRVGGDICVVGSGAAGFSAALEAAKLGRRVVLADASPALGGQAVNSIIATFCGLYSNGERGYQFTHGVADDLLRDLGAMDRALWHRHGPATTVVYYDEIALSRWVEESVRAAGISVLLGAVLRGVERDGGRVRSLEFATRYGDVVVEAQGFIDATGDAALAWQAGFDCRESATAPVFGTQMVVLENIVEERHPSREEMAARMAEHAARYRLVRKNAVSFVIPGRGIAALNMTHTDTPLEPLAASRAALDGKAQADRAVTFLREVFPDCFGRARVRAYGLPGIRQTRWIAGVHQLTLEEVRAGRRHPDAIGRTAWPVELHDTGEGYKWQTFPKDHVHWIPLRSMIPREADNVVAAGRCVDADLAALSSIRVMGPCIAMGAAAAHALDLAGAGSVRQIDIAALQARVADNLERKDAPWPIE